MTSKVVSLSEKSITKGQAGKFSDVLIDALVKSGLSSGSVQRVLEIQGAALAKEFVVAVQRRAEAIALSRTVVVNWSRSKEEAFTATGRR